MSGLVEAPVTSVRWRWPAVLAAIFGLAVTAACSSETSAEAEAEARWVDDGGATAVHQLNYGYSIEGPADWEVRFAGHRSERDSRCEYQTGSVGRLSFTIVGRHCDSPQSPGNGDSGHYLSPDQAPATNITEHELDDSMLVTFTQVVFICTNDCYDEDELVALFIPDQPADPEFPVLQLVVDPAKRDVDDLVTAGSAITVDPEWDGVSMELFEITDELSIEAPRGNVVSTSGLSRARVRDAGADCEVREVRVSGHTTFNLVGAECTADQQATDFNPGWYSTVDRAIGATDVEVVEVEAGSLTLFDVTPICDDECLIDAHVIGLLNLEAGSSEDYPTVQFRANSSGEARASLIELADAIRVRP